jgi:hypothetical protein
MRMAISARLRTLTEVIQAALVALTYDLARSVALLGSSAHHRRSNKTEAPS